MGPKTASQKIRIIQKFNDFPQEFHSQVCYSYWNGILTKKFRMILFPPLLFNTHGRKIKKFCKALRKGQDCPLFTKMWPKEGRTECAEDSHPQKCETQHLQKAFFWSYFSFLAKCSPRSLGWSCHGHAALVLDGLPFLRNGKFSTRFLIKIVVLLDCL